MQVISKSKQVEHHIRKTILRGKWLPGQILPSERVLLDQFNVSRTTLRDALNRLASEKLLERKQGAGTYVAQMAKKVGMVAILAKSELLTSPMGYFYQRVVAEAQERIKADGYRPVLSVGHGKTTESFISSIHLLDTPIARETLGVLSTLDMGDLEEKLKRAGIYSVALAFDTPIAKYCVFLNQERLIELGMRLLREHGYSDYVLMIWEGPDSNRNKKTEERLCRWLQQFGESQPESRLVKVQWSWDVGDAYGAFTRLWNGPRRPRAIFFTDDCVCDVATRAILELGIKVPEELAIVTHANIGRTFHFPVPLTRVEYDPAEATAAAWKMLSTLIEGRTPEESVVYIQPRIRQGASLGERIGASVEE